MGRDAGRAGNQWKEGGLGFTLSDHEKERTHICVCTHARTHLQSDSEEETGRWVVAEQKKGQVGAVKPSF